MLALLLVAGPGGRGPAAAAALGLPAAPVDHSVDHSTTSALELTVEHTEIASGLVVEPAHAPASKAVHKVVLLDAEPEVQQMPPKMPPLVDQARSPTGSEPTRYRRVTRRAYQSLPRAYPGRATTRAPRYS